jgi:hypothetical protein
MHQVNARHEIIREWRSLPKELRQTDEQAAAFAMQIKDKYKFSSDNGDPYQTVMGWLLCYLSLTRRMEWRAEGEGEYQMTSKKWDDPQLDAAQFAIDRFLNAEQNVSEQMSEIIQSIRDGSATDQDRKRLKALGEQYIALSKEVEDVMGRLLVGKHLHHTWLVWSWWSGRPVELGSSDCRSVTASPQFSCSFDGTLFLIRALGTPMVNV